MEFNLRKEAIKQYNSIKNFVDENIIKKEWIPIIHISKKIIENFNFNFDNYKIQKLFFSNSTINNFDYDNVIEWWIIKNIIWEISFLDCLFNEKIIKWIKPNWSFHFSNNKNILNVFRIKYNNKVNRKWIINFHNFRILEFIISNQNIKNRVSKFKKIRIYNNIELKSLLIENIIIDELVLESINNNFKSFEIRNCVIDKLIIRNSNLWKAVFNWVTIKELEIQNATVNDCIFNWVDFCNNYQLTEIEKEKWIVDYKIMKDNYRQLKHVMDKNANYTEANKFFALEMEYQRLHLSDWKQNKWLLYNLSQSFFGSHAQNWWQLFILNISSLINEFWNNISRNIFVIYLYIILATLVSYMSNKMDYFSNNLEWNHLLWLLCLFLWLWLILYILWKIFTTDKVLSYIDTKLESKIFAVFAHIFIFWFLLYLCTVEVNRFYWIETFTYLLNPFSWLTDRSMMNLLWTEKIWLIIHKIIYWTLIYQLIIALKRTTKR